MNREKDAILVKDLFKNYVGFCLENNLKACTAQTLGKRLKRTVTNELLKILNGDDRVSYEKLKHRTSSQGLALRCVYINSGFDAGCVG